MKTRVQLVVYAAQNLGLPIIKYLSVQKNASIRLVILYPEQKNQPIHTFVKQNDIPFIFAHPLSLQYLRIKLIQPDIIISAGWKHKIPTHILRCARRGGVNIHPGLLPSYAGTLVHSWAIANGDKKTGSTIHWMTSQFDAGKIIHQDVFPIYAWDDGSSIYKKLLMSATRGFRHAWKHIDTWEKIAKEQRGPRTLYTVSKYRSHNMLDLNKKVTMQKAINILRSRSFRGYRVAYFIDPDTKQKVYVNLQLTPERN